MRHEKSKVVVLAGPNGAGKSTASASLLKDTLAVTEFVNADTIALGLSAFAPDRAAIAAGRVMLGRIRELAPKKADFAFETTLASRTVAPFLATIMKDEYEFHLVFLWLSSAELAVRRVADPVKNGGHDVPEETIRRRYRSGLANFFAIYRSIATSWQVFDNSEFPGMWPVACGRASGETPFDKAAWHSMLEAVNNGGTNEGH